MRKIQFSFLLPAMLFAELVCAQPLVASQDTFIDALAPTSNFGALKHIRVKASATEREQAGLIAFDLGPILGVPVGKATLRLHVNKVSQAGEFSVREVESAWAELAVTFDTAPSVGAIVASQSVVSGDQGNYLEIDITNLVSDWASGARPNYGIALVPQSPGMKVWFSSRETSFGPELVVSGKTNVATVEKSGGDYTDPVVAINDRDTWCEPAISWSDEDCRLLIGPGVFELSETLAVPGYFQIIGAGKSGSKRTELVTLPGVDTAVHFFTENSVRNSISDLIIRNIAGTSGTARGILGFGTFGSSFNPRVDVRNVSVEVSGGLVANVGIRIATDNQIENVDVRVTGVGATGLSTNCSQAVDVQVRVEADFAEAARGWSAGSDDCSEPTITRFQIFVRGSADSIGLSIGNDAANLVSDGTIFSSGTGLFNSTNGRSNVSNVVVVAPTAFDAHEGLLSLSNVSTEVWTYNTDVALKIGEGGALVSNSRLIGETTGILLEPGSTGGGAIDSSVVQGRVNSILGDATVPLFIGSSKIVGSISLSAGSLSCLYVYDNNYQPVTCP